MGGNPASEGPSRGSSDGPEGHTVGEGWAATFDFSPDPKSGTLHTLKKKSGGSLVKLVLQEGR